MPHQKIIEAIDERYRGGNPKRIATAKRAGTYELILLALELVSLSRQILDLLKTGSRSKPAERVVHE